MVRFTVIARLLKIVGFVLAFVQLTSAATECALETGNDMTIKSFSLRIGDQRTLADPDLMFKFAAVLEDSRCPEGVTCFWEGNAAVSIEVQHGDETPRTVTLNTHGSPKMPHSAEVFDHVVKLEDLTPYPRQDELIESPDYEATLTVKPMD